MSLSNQRRRRWRTVAATLALSLGSLAIPAAALADGQLDPAFNGTGYHIGSAAESTLFSQQDNRVPMVAQADNKIVIGGSNDGFMTLARYNTDGSLDTTFGAAHTGIVQTQFAGTPGSLPGGSGATAMTLDADGDIIAAGFGGVARDGRRPLLPRRRRRAGQRRLLRPVPHRLLRPRRGRASRTAPSCSSAMPAIAGPPQTVPAGAGDHVRPARGRDPPGRYGEAHEHRRPAAPTSPSRARPACRSTVSAMTARSPMRRSRPAATTRASPQRTTNAYVVASTAALAPTANLVAVDQSAWVQRFTATGVGALDATFTPAGTGPRRRSRAEPARGQDRRPTAPRTSPARRSAERPTPARCSSRA